MLLNGADVASLSTDDAAFHFLTGKRYSGNGDLGDMIRRAALNGESHDVARLIIRFVLEFLLKLDHLFGLLVLDLLNHILYQLVPCLLGGHAGYALKRHSCLCLLILKIFRELFVFLNLFSERFFLFLKSIGLAVQIFFFGLHSSLLTGKLAAAFFDFLFKLILRTKHFFFCFYEGFFFCGCGV